MTVAVETSGKTMFVIVAAGHTQYKMITHVPTTGNLAFSLNEAGLDLGTTAFITRDDMRAAAVAILHHLDSMEAQGL